MMADGRWLKDDVRWLTWSKNQKCPLLEFPLHYNLTDSDRQQLSFS
jgi:hypothetical protein